MKWGMWTGHAVIALSFLLMLATVLTFKLAHHWRRRRAPLQDRRVGHLPGQQLLARISHHDTELQTSISLMTMALPLMFMVWLTFRVQWQSIRFGVGEAMFVVGGLGAFCWGLIGYIKHYRARERVRDGWTAEQVTGMQLNRLIAQGCVVLHDLPADGFNIDHVVVAPRGVYAVETKSFRKPKDAEQDKSYRVTVQDGALRFPDFIEKDAIAQAERYAGWLAGVLCQAQFDAPVIPALALPGWLVDQSDDTWRSSKVKVFSPMGNGANFMAKDLGRIDSTERSRIAQALALRYPKISD